LLFPCFLTKTFSSFYITGLSELTKREDQHIEKVLVLTNFADRATAKSAFFFRFAAALLVLAAT
jgi:hypothetical protein